MDIEEIDSPATLTIASSYNIIHIYKYVAILILVVQLQRNSHADKTCIMSSGQYNTCIRQEMLIATRSIVAS